MSVTIVPVGIHYLDHPIKPRQYTYRVYPDYTLVERWEDGICKWRERYNTVQARKHYGYMRGLGYIRF